MLLQLRSNWLTHNQAFRLYLEHRMQWQNRIIFITLFYNITIDLSKLNHYSASALIFASESSIGVTKFKGVNLRPSALKNFELNSTHCRRRAWRKHSIESIPMITPAVIDTKKYIPINIMIALALTIPPPIVFSKNTRANWPWANDKAHKRR